MVLHEINKAHEERWATVKPRSEGKAQKERTGPIVESSLGLYYRDMDIAQQREEVSMHTGLIVEKGSEM